MSLPPITILSLGSALYYTKREDGSLEAFTEGSNVSTVNVGGDVNIKSLNDSEVGTLLTSLGAQPVKPVKLSEVIFTLPAGKHHAEQSFRTIIEQVSLLKSSHLTKQQILRYCRDIHQDILEITNYTDQILEELRKSIEKANQELVEVEQERTNVSNLLNKVQQCNSSPSQTFCLHNLNRSIQSIESVIKFYGLVATSLKQVNLNLKALSTKYGFLNYDVQIIKDLALDNLLPPDLISDFILNVSDIQGSFTKTLAFFEN